MSKSHTHGKYAWSNTTVVRDLETNNGTKYSIYDELLSNAGFTAVDIGNRVGHESIRITYHYSHMFPSKQIAMAV